MNRPMIRHGMILILLALVSGLLVHSMEIPRLALSAHTIAVLSGVLLIAIGGAWPAFTLSGVQEKVMYLAWLYASYVNWLACQVGAALGAGRMTPLSAAGTTGPAFAEGLVGLLLGTVVIASFLAVGLSLWGLRGGRQPTAG